MDKIKPNDILTITVKNWDEYQEEQRQIAREKGSTKFNWWKFSNDYFDDEKIRQAGVIGQAVFNYILTMCSKQDRNCILTSIKSISNVLTTGIQRTSNVRVTIIKQYLKLLHDIDLIEINSIDKRREEKIREEKVSISTDAFDDVEHQMDTAKIPSVKVSKKTKPKNQKPKEPAPTSIVWENYRLAYLERYGTEPIGGAKQNGILSRIVKQVGVDEASKLVKFYVNQNSAWYVQKAHPLDSLAYDLQKLTVELRTGTTITRKQAESVERSSSNLTEFEKTMKALGGNDELF